MRAFSAVVGGCIAAATFALVMAVATAFTGPSSNWYLVPLFVVALVGGTIGWRAGA